MKTNQYDLFSLLDDYLYSSEGFYKACNAVLVKYPKHSAILLPGLTEKQTELTDMQSRFATLPDSTMKAEYMRRLTEAQEENNDIIEKVKNHLNQ